MQVSIETALALVVLGITDMSGLFMGYGKKKHAEKKKVRDFVAYLHTSSLYVRSFSPLLGPYPQPANK